MITQYDIDVMENDIADIIKSWNNTLDILLPLPVDQQTNYNTIMNEFIGEILYDKISIPAERKDMQNMIENDISDNKHGDIDGGTLMFTIPSTYGYILDNPTECIILYNNEKWYIRNTKIRIGEIIITIKKLISNTDDWGD